MAIAGTLACVLFATSCASPGVKRLSQPLASSPLVGDLLGAERLTPGTRTCLTEQGLAAVYRNEPAEAISELHERLASSASPDDLVLPLIELCSDTAERFAEKDPRVAVGYYLAAAELAFESALEAAGGGNANDLFAAAYNHSAGQVAKILFDSNHSWTATATFDGPWKSYHLRCRTDGDHLVDPANFDSLKLTDYIELKHYEMEHIRRAGIGAAMIGHWEGTPERREANPFLSPIGMTLPVNAVVDFRRGGNEAELRLSDLLLGDEVVVHGRKLPMTADLTVPLAVQVDYDIDRKKGFRAMTHPDDYLDHSGLYLLEPFRPDQIPVIFVHGLMSKPEVWLEALNQLRADPVLVRKYQLLVYRYPTGYPVIYNVASLRKHLAAFQDRYDPRRRNPNMRKILLIGHSMGGVISSAVVRGSGDVFTGFLFTRPIDELGDLDDEQKAALKELLIFDANPDITRVIFVAAPHRGAKMATGGIGALGRSLIKIPRKLILDQSLSVIEGMTEQGRSLITSRPDSIGSLKPGAPVLTAILENPVRQGVVVHSIIGHLDPTKPLEASDDGTVAYTSAHLDEAISEKVVHAKHTPLCKHPATIEELRRIFYLHAGL